jgi:hypothetical protein
VVGSLAIGAGLSDVAGDVRVRRSSLDLAYAGGCGLRVFPTRRAQKHRPFMLGQRHPSGDMYTDMESWIATLANRFEPLLDTDPETILSPPLP